MVDELIQWFVGLAPWLSYVVLAAGAAAENLFPPLPADTVILLGGILAGQGILDPWVVFLVTWVFNGLGALGVWWAGSRLGRPFFETGMGRHLLDREHLGALARFHARWGSSAIFLSRFLPGFRALVPVFAGISRLPLWRVALPVFVASGIWYGALVGAGMVAGENLPRILEFLANLNRGLVVASGVLALALLLWWRRRREGRQDDGGGEEEGAGG